MCPTNNWRPNFERAEVAQLCIVAALRTLSYSNPVWLSRVRVLAVARCGLLLLTESVSVSVGHVCNPCKNC